MFTVKILIKYSNSPEMLIPIRKVHCLEVETYTSMEAVKLFLKEFVDYKDYKTQEPLLEIFRAFIYDNDVEREMFNLKDVEVVNMLHNFKGKKN